MKTNKKQMQQWYNQFKRISYSDIYTVYKRPSDEKMIAYHNLVNKYCTIALDCNVRCSFVKVLSHCTQSFVTGCVVGSRFYVDTYMNTYEISLDELY